jgi:hypothetical protein
MTKRAAEVPKEVTTALDDVQVRRELTIAELLL